MTHAGPGKAWSALEQGEYLFQLAERKPSFIKVPVALMDGIIGFLDLLAKVFPGLEVRCYVLSCPDGILEEDRLAPVGLSMVWRDRCACLGAPEVTPVMPFFKST